MENEIMQKFYETESGINVDQLTIEQLFQKLSDSFSPIAIASSLDSHRDESHNII